MRPTVTDFIKKLQCTATIANGPITFVGKFFRRTKPKVYGKWDPEAHIEWLDLTKGRQNWVDKFAKRYGFPDFYSLSGNVMGERKFDLTPILQHPEKPLGVPVKWESELTLEEQLDMMYVLYWDRYTGTMSCVYDTILRKIDDAIATGKPIPTIYPTLPYPPE